MTFITIDFPGKTKYDKLLIDGKDLFPIGEGFTNSIFVSRNKEIKLLERISSDITKNHLSGLCFLQGINGTGKTGLLREFIRKKINSLDFTKNEIFITIPIDPLHFQYEFTFKDFYSIVIDKMLENEIIKWLGYNICIKILQTIENITEKSTFSNQLNKLGIQNSLYEEAVINPHKIHQVMDNLNFLVKFWNFFESNYHKISSQLPINNFDLFSALLYSGFQNPETFNAIRGLKGQKRFQDFDITHEKECRKAFNDLLKIFDWISPNTQILFIIDDVETSIKNIKDNFKRLFTILLNLKTINSLFFVISGTTALFTLIEDQLEEDMIKQINDWTFGNNIFLQPLPIEEILTVIQHYLSSYWRTNGLATPSLHPLYPFTDETIHYLYMLTNKNLYQILKKLNQAIDEMRTNQEILYVNDIFNAYTIFKNSSLPDLSYNEAVVFKNKFFSDDIKYKDRINRLKDNFHLMLNEINKSTKNLKNISTNPNLGNSGITPHLYFEVGQELRDNRRIAVEFDFNPKKSRLKKKKLQKVISLIKLGMIDYLILITNNPFDESILKLESNIIHRIHSHNNLSDLNLGYLSLLYFKDDLSFEWSISNVIFLLEKIGIDIFDITSKAVLMERSSEIQLAQDQESSISIDDLIDFPLEFFDEEETEDMEQEPVNLDESAIELDQPAISTVAEEIEEENEIIKEHHAQILYAINKSFENNFCHINTVITELKKTGLDLENITSPMEAYYVIVKVAELNKYGVSATRIYYI
ncbi:MAG: hypothetical protein OEZ01_07610 [Candidatus Heimdallarchaeota archaeon]|nr:hypothetical protein [Candidatus Heimdallarchaeota archaeon]MDH5645858.1 hypothetical protein [Candidatus Heimdallarchaeota archaeon]